MCIRIYIIVALVSVCHSDGSNTSHEIDFSPEPKDVADECLICSDLVQPVSLQK